MKIAVIGCGYWGENLVRNFYKLGYLNVIYDVDLQNAKRLSKKFKVPILKFEEILNTDIDGIAISSPAASHYDIAKKCLLSNKHVFIEKPLALEISHAKSLIKIAERRNKKIMVGHLLHYHPAFERIKDELSRGLIGEIKFIYSNRMSFGKVRSEEDVLWSFAPHDISMILSLVKSPIKSINCFSKSIIKKNIADIASINLSFKNNTKAQISCSWINPFKEHKMTIIGTEGSIIFDDTKRWEEKLSHHKLKIDDSLKQLIKKSKPRYLKIKEKEPLERECQSFIDFISGKINIPSNGEEGLNVLKVLKKASESLKKNN